MRLMRLSAAPLGNPGSSSACCNVPQVYFIKPSAESVAVVFPMRFGSSQDAAIGHAFLQVGRPVGRRRNA